MPHVRTIPWLREHTSYGGDACLIWPFSRKADGRGNLKFEGRVQGAHVAMCILVNGPAPSDLHEVAHSCGNGHGGCVHPQHVSWKTPSENHADTIAHGNGRKPGGPRRKLSEQDVAEIRELKDDLTQAERAVLFGVSNTTIAEIDRGRSHQDRPKRHGRKIPIEARPHMAQRARELREAGKTLEYIGAVLGVSRLTWMQQDNNGPIVSCPLCNDDGRHSRS